MDEIELVQAKRVVYITGDTATAKLLGELQDTQQDLKVAEDKLEELDVLL